MKKIILTLSILLISISLFSQNEILDGKWTFDQVQSNEEMDEESMQMIELIFNGMYLAFDSNKYEQSIMDKTENGTWIKDEDGMYFISSKGFEYFVSIEKKSDSIILFNYKKMKIQLKKSEESFQIQDFEDSLDKVDGIDIDSTIIIGKWNWTGTIKKDGTNSPAIKHSKDEPTNYNFKSGGVFENRAPFGMKLYAYWQVSEDLQYLIIQSEDKNEYFKVLKLENNFLEIYNPKDESILKFEKHQA